MTLGQKIAGLFLILGLSFVVGSYFALKLTVFPAFEDLEYESALEDRARVQRTLESDLRALEIMNMEYSIWDQTYEYAAGRRPQYPEENMDPVYWHSVDTHMMLIFDADGSLLSGLLSHPADGRRLDLNEELLTPLEGGHPLVTHESISSSVKGLLQTRVGILQVVSYPVLTSEGEGPIAGSLVAGQFLTGSRAAQISRRATTDVSIFELNRGDPPPRIAAALRALEDSGQATLIEIEEAAVRSYEILQDVFGQPIAVLEVTTPRAITQVGAATLRTGTLFLASASLAFLLAALLFLRRIIVARVRSLTNKILAIQKTGDLDIEPGDYATDEIGVLASEFGELTRKLSLAQKELEQARDEAVTLSNTKSEFLARMSHEIRTPMNGVLGMTELLSNTALNDKQLRFVRTIYESADSLLDIINDILDFSKIEAGKLKLESIELNLRSLVEETVEGLADEAHRKGIELITVLPPDMHAAVRSDPVRLRQVLTNLVSNAVKFTPEGEVVVRLRTMQGDAGQLDVTFEVADTGIGIPEEKQSVIFEAFTQQDGTTTRLYGGTGLGLAISSQIVELLGGELSVESKPGEGSRFSFRLGLEAVTDESDTRHDDMECIAGKCVLIVDDNATNREILELQLASWRASSDSACGAAEAMELLEAAVADGRPHDIAILDMHMPQTDGIGLAGQIRAIPALDGVKLIILSSIAAPASAAVLEELDIAGQLTKPVRQADLYSSLVAVISGRRMLVPHVRGKRRLANSLCGNVLLAEDNAVNKAVAVGMLETLGLSVVVASSGREAVEQAAATAYDVILMDCQMPDLDGFQATEAIRRLEADIARTETPIIAVTANALKGDREKCLAAGMNDYLSKPFTIEQLHAILAPRLGQASGAEADVANSVQEAEAHGTPASPIDRRVLDMLSGLQQAGAPSILQKVIDVYLENSRELKAKLGAAVESANDDLIRESAHALKSSSANVGAMDLADLCKRLETMGREGHIDGAPALHERLEREYERVVAALQLEAESEAA